MELARRGQEAMTAFTGLQRREVLGSDNIPEFSKRKGRAMRKIIEEQKAKPRKESMVVFGI